MLEEYAERFGRQLEEELEQKLSGDQFGQVMATINAA
jgi:hypothetical protein